MKPKLFIWCPLPPAKTGTAVYMAEQLPALRDWFDITVVVASEEDAHLASKEFNVDVVSSLTAVRERNAKHLIHLANNPWHEYCYHGAMQLNPYLIIHDGSLQHLVTEITLARGDKTQYLNTLEYDAGMYGRRFAMQRDLGFYTERMLFYVRCFRPLIERAQGVIAHSVWAKEYLRLRYNPKQITYVPHHSFIAPDIAATDKSALRQELGIDQDHVVFSVPGYLSKAKDISTLLEIVENTEKHHKCTLVISGEGEMSELSDDEKAVLERTAKRTGFLPDREFEKVIRASDFVSCLRYPTTGESSGVFSKTLAAGSIPLYTPILGGYEKQTCGIPVSRTEAGRQEAQKIILDLISKHENRAVLEQEIFNIHESRTIQKCAGKIARFLS